MEDSQANSKEWNNGLIKLSKAAKVYMHPFALNVSMKLQGIIAILSGVLSGADIQKSRSSGIVILAGKYGILDKKIGWKLGKNNSLLAIFSTQINFGWDSTHNTHFLAHTLYFYRFAGKNFKQLTPSTTPII